MKPGDIVRIILPELLPSGDHPYNDWEAEIQKIEPKIVFGTKGDVVWVKLLRDVWGAEAIPAKVIEVSSLYLRLVHPLVLLAREASK